MKLRKVSERREESTALVVIYNNADLYPPTLNTMELLAVYYDRVVLLELDNLQGKTNVVNYKITRNQVAYKSTNPITRFNSFLKFVQKIRALIKLHDPELIFFYDAEAALAVHLATLGLKVGAKRWYHVHDTADKKYIIRYSLNYYSLKFQNNIFRNLDVFSLPAEERKAYFDLSDFSGEYVFLPNYPLKKHLSPFLATQPVEEIVIIYQGRICAGRGIEEVIKLLPLTIEEKPVRLELIGFAEPHFKKRLNAIINQCGVIDRVNFRGVIANRLLPAITSKCHIGLAIYTSQDNMHSTLGTASNKSYEYSACGLPFFYFKTPHFEHHFKNMPWALPTDLTESSLKNNLIEAIKNFSRLSAAARKDFYLQRNYEHFMDPVLKNISSGE